MRIRTRSTVLALATAGALVVGAVAYGAPPNPNDSTVNFSITPANGALATAAPGPIRPLFVHMHTVFKEPGNKPHGGYLKTVVLRLDSDFTITPGAIPNCTPATLASKTIAQAW